MDRQTREGIVRTALITGNACFAKCGEREEVVRLICDAEETQDNRDAEARRANPALAFVTHPLGS